MSNLLASLNSTGSALRVYQHALDVIQANITNASTPGYAKQALGLAAMPFDLAGGLAGGVAARGLDSARDEYAEQEVRRQLQALGRTETQVQGTTSIENLFDVSGNSGIPKYLSAIFDAFSAWSVNPNDEAARQQVLASAGQLATGIQQLANSLSAISTSTGEQIGTTVSQINQLTEAIQQFNIQRLRQTSPDPGLDANLHSTLEQLSELVNITTLTQPDGTVTVLLPGGSPLVIGTEEYPVSAGLSVPTDATNPGGPPSSRILDASGADISSQVQGGKLGGLLDVHNRVLSSLIGDGATAGSLNEFAKSFADTVNGILQAGFVSTDAGAANGLPLFVYDGSDPTAATRSFALNPAIGAGDLAAADANGNANGNALKLASLANSAANGGIAGQTLNAYFSGITMFVGNESAAATQAEQDQQDSVAQARQLRDATSGVSLDEQAVLLLQFQKNYEAAGRLLSTLNDIAETAINLIPA